MCNSLSHYLEQKYEYNEETNLKSGNGSTEHKKSSACTPEIGASSLPSHIYDGPCDYTKDGDATDDAGAAQKEGQ